MWSELSKDEKFIMLVAYAACECGWGGDGSFNIDDVRRLAYCVNYNEFTDENMEMLHNYLVLGGKEESLSFMKGNYKPEVLQ